MAIVLPPQICDVTSPYVFHGVAIIAIAYIAFTYLATRGKNRLFERSYSVGCWLLAPFMNLKKRYTFEQTWLTDWWNQLLANVFAVARPSVVCLSVVCNVRAPYSGGSNFRRYFYGIRYLDHPYWHPLKISRRSSQGNPSAGGVKHKRGSHVYSDFGRIDGYISKTVQDRTGGKLVLIANRKSYMSFRLVPKSVTLNDLERRNCVILHYFSEFG